MVHPLVNPLCGPAYLTSCHTHSPINDNHATFPAGAETVTFVRHPFPLDEALQHLAWLQHWGFTFGELSFFLCSSPLVSSSFPPSSLFPHHLGGC